MNLFYNYCCMFFYNFIRHSHTCTYFLTYTLSLPHTHSTSLTLPHTHTHTHTHSGEWQKALPHVEQSIVLAPKYQYAYGYRGLLKHTLGWPGKALIDLNIATASIDYVDNVVASLAGVCYTCLGKITRSRMYLQYYYEKF